MARDPLPTLPYAARDGTRRGPVPARWWVLGVSGGVPIAFVAFVHAMYLGDCLRLGREPTPGDASMWPGPVFMLTIVLSVMSAFASIVAFFAGAYACAIEHGERHRGRMIAALTLAFVGPIAIGAMRLDPVGAFSWWFD